MTSCTIQKVDAVQGLVPRLQFTTKLRLEHGTANERLFVLKWIGDIGFTRHAESANGMSQEGPNKVVLHARWTSEPEWSRTWSGREQKSVFSCEMPTKVMDALERFRDAGRLFARVQGKIQVMNLGGGNLDDAASALIPQLTNSNYMIWADVWGDSMELTRDLWCEELLPVLRPPGRVVLEAALPKNQAQEEHGKRALGHLQAADRAFDEGRYDEVARLIYKAGEALQALGNAVSTRYGDLAQTSIAKQNSAVQALCHPERHDDVKVSGGHETDRTMALHLIVSMKALASVYLAASLG